MLKDSKLALTGFGLYFAGFVVTFAPYAFVSSAAETAQMMQGIGGWTMIIGAVMGLLGYVANTIGAVVGLQQLRQGQSSSVPALVWNLLPALGVPLLAFIYRATLF
ncbi:hypothetical protein [uncultured Ferrimonas sp.]|uniref:hypothetical protein n=1 Tax=uncultured Ferrimonas sp. TaxID=432640 RepID=UPI0026127719|nr:hypothetical protein [uncultured Ferrimonas sp.]